MTDTHEQDASPPVFQLALAGELTIYRAIELKQEILAGLDHQGSIEIDLSKVSELDSAGVQLLLFAKQTAQAKQQALRIVAQSAAVLEVFTLLGLAAHFAGAPAVPASSEAAR